MGIAGDFVLIVVAGLVGGILARAMRLPLLVGYIAAGVVVGPNTAGPTVVQIHDIELLAEIGVALLLFALGLEISFRELRPVRRIALVGGPIQIAATAVFGSLLIRSIADASWSEAAWFGAMVSLSSTMVVLKTLSAEGTSATLASRVMIGLLIVQDLAVVPMLIVLPQLGALAGAGRGAAEALVTAALFLLGMIVVGTRLLPAVLRRVLAWGSRELFLVAVLAAGVGIGYVTYRLGLSFALGAFVAGVVLSESELSHQALSDVVPLRDVFALLFFVSVGMLFDPRYLTGHASSVVLVVAVVLVGKALICGLLARAFGYVNMAPWIVGLGLSQVGEFSFVLARAGLAGGFVSKNTYDLALMTTIVSMAVSPVVFAAAHPLARGWARRRTSRPPRVPIELPGPELHDHVVIAGYGRTGRAIAAALRTAGIPFAVIELNHAVLSQPLNEGLPAVWGDIGSEDVLRAAGIGRARALVVAAPDWNATLLGIQRARQLNTRLFIVARAPAARHVPELHALGVDAVVQPEFEGGVEMVRRTLGRYDRGEADIERLTADLRQDFYGGARAE